MKKATSSSVFAETEVTFYLLYDLLCTQLAHSQCTLMKIIMTLEQKHLLQKCPKRKSAVSRDEHNVNRVNIYCVNLEQ